MWSLNIKDIQDLLYNCNVNFYQMEINEHMCFDITLNEQLSNIDIDDLKEELSDIVGADNYTFEEDVISIFLPEFFGR